MIHIKRNFYFQLGIFSTTLYLINLVFNSMIFDIYFIIPLWKIYAFNTVLVLITFWTIKLLTKTKLNLLFSFIIASINKMLLTILFVYPIIHFDGDKQGLIVTFFIIYFIFLFFEIKSLQKVFDRWNHCCFFIWNINICMYICNRIWSIIIVTLKTIVLIWKIYFF